MIVPEDHWAQQGVQNRSAAPDATMELEGQAYFFIRNKLLAK